MGDESVDIDFDPLGHQRSSISKLKDESSLKKQQNQKNQQKAQDLLGLVPKQPPNPSLMQVKGGVSYHNATASGQNIIRGMQPYDVPDLPPENNANSEKKSIANMGVEVNGKNKGRESG